MKIIVKTFLSLSLSFCLCTTVFGKQVDMSEGANTPVAKDVSIVESGRVRELTSPRGLKYRILESHLNSLVGVSFAFPGGSDMIVNGKFHVASMASTVMMMGAGDWSESELAELLDDNGIGLSVKTNSDVFAVNGLIPTENVATATRVIKQILFAPKLAPEDLNRAKVESIALLRQAVASVEGVSGILQALYPDFQYERPPAPIFQRINSIQREDILAYLEAVLRKDRLMTVFVGDIDPVQAGKIVDELFADLPNSSAVLESPNSVVVSAPQIEFPRAASINVFRGLNGPQTVVRLTIPWHAPDDQDYFASRVALQIFGLGGFSSRLMDEIRERGGYTYGIYSSPEYRLIGNSMVVEYATRNEAVGESLHKVLEVWDKFVTEGPTVQEVELAKGFLLGYMPQRLESVSAATLQLFNIQSNKLGGGKVNFLETFSGVLRSLTPEEVVRATKKWFQKDRVQITIVGQPIGVEGAQERSIEDYLNKALR